MGFTLYDFQQQDVELLLPRSSALIASEMGTGKTHEAIALMEGWWKKGAKPDLVVAPLDTHSSWVEKYAMQAPHTDVVCIDRKNRDAFIDAVERRRGDVFICHWEALWRMPEIQRLGFNTIVGDEVHRIANRKSQTAKALKKMGAKHRLGMSGTASGDKPVDLWSILNWLWPKYYSSFWRFWNNYVITEMSYHGYQKVVGVRNTDHLKREMRTWYVRHLKNEQCCPHHPQGVMPWLEDKVYDRRWVDLSPTQRRVYDQMKKRMVAWLGEQEDTPLLASVAIAQLARLSQMALATPVFDEEGKIDLTLPSSKADAVLELLEDNPDKKFVVATSSKKMAYLLEDFLGRKDIGSVVLSGDTRQTQRDNIVYEFVDASLAQCRAFIGVIDAMAEGIDGLQHATDTMIFLDRSWRTIKNHQCEDRLHRDGQKNAVQIIDIVARGTVDTARHKKLELKWDMIRQMLGDDTKGQKS